MGKEGDWQQQQQQPERRVTKGFLCLSLSADMAGDIYLLTRRFYVHTMCVDLAGDVCRLSYVPSREKWFQVNNIHNSHIDMKYLISILILTKFNNIIAFKYSSFWICWLYNVLSTRESSESYPLPSPPPSLLLLVPLFSSLYPSPPPRPHGFYLEQKGRG